jgi:hypothetical protein
LAGEHTVMTSAWKEPPGRDDRAEGQDAGPDENQLEMFDVTPRAGAEMLLPPGGDFVYGSARHEGGGQGHFLDADGADSDELRRLEDSIRWLMNESGVRHIPRAATLPPVRGLSTVELHDDDSLLLNPETLFAPHLSRRRGSLASGAAKILLVTAVAAPTAYFIANWMQFPGTATPSDSATISEPAAISGSMLGQLEERVAAVVPGLGRPTPDAAPIGDEIPGAAQLEPTVKRGMLPVEPSPEGPAGASAAEPKGAPEQPAVVVVSTTPPDPAPGPVGTNAAQSSSPSPQAVAASPKKPVMSAAEIALMVERGRVLFDSGDLAAARLFFRRAANAGDAAAALAMGATYDPDILSKRFIRGIEADAQEARTWYERARDLGSPEGPRRIETLLAQKLR